MNENNTQTEEEVLRTQFFEDAMNIANTMFPSLSMVQIGQHNDEVMMLFNKSMDINTSSNEQKSIYLTHYRYPI